MKGKRRGRAALLALAFLLTGCGTPAPSPGKEAPSAAPAAGESYQAPPLALAEFDEAAAFGESGVLLSVIILSSGVLYEMVGPVCAKAALRKAGAFSLPEKNSPPTPPAAP